MVSPEHNAWAGLLSPTATAACMLDIPSLQPKFPFEELPAQSLAYEAVSTMAGLQQRPHAGGLCLVHIAGH